MVSSSKNIAWTEKELSEALGQSINFKFSASKVDFNSKDIEEGDIFLVLPGEKRHGYEFIEDALARGAGAIISDKPYDHPKVILVENSFKALISMAKYKRQNSKAKFIAVTGSVGKTSTKEAIGFILSKFGRTFWNKGSFNNHIGVPLSLASIPLNAEYCVNELGMNAPGEIRELTKLVRPHIAIITMIGEAHLENLRTIENICKAKCEIFESLDPSGTAIINMDSPLYELQREILASLNINSILTFGMNKNSDACLSSFESGDNNKAIYRVFDEEIDTSNHLYGKHQAVNLASVLLVAKRLSLNLNEVGNGFVNLPRVKGRGEEFEVSLEGNKFSIINDAYNANPTSVKASLEALSKREGKKIAILADMRELGQDEINIHRSLKEHVINTGVAKVFFIGKCMKYLYDDFQEDIQKDIGTKIDAYFYYEANNDSFKNIISKLGQKDATILVKGSNSTKVSGFVDYCLGKV